MKKQVGQSVLAVLLVVVMTCSVQAVIVVSGDPGTGNSWYQRFNYDTNSTKHDTDYVMRLSVKQISGDTLELPHPIRDNASPSPTSNAPAGWTYDTIFGSEVDAIKTASQNIQSVNFSVWFNGNYVNTSAKIEIDTVIWEWVKSSCQWQFVQDGCDKAVATWANGKWCIDDSCMEQGDLDLYGCVGPQGPPPGCEVPEPATFVIWSLLGGLGLVLAWRKRKVS